MYFREQKQAMLNKSYYSQTELDLENHNWIVSKQKFSFSLRKGSLMLRTPCILLATISQQQFFLTNVSSTNSKQSKLCINSPLHIDTRLLWKQAIRQFGIRICLENFQLPSLFNAHGLCFGLILEETVCSQCRTEIHEEVMYGAMAWMNKVGLVLEQFVDAFYYISLAQHHLVP